MKNYFLIIILLLIISLGVYLKFRKDKNKIKENYLLINSKVERETINKYTLPLIEDRKKYIELQTKDWIEKRNKLGYCYGLLEKDKIIMTKWILKYNIRSPKIYFYSYHNNFSLQALREIAVNNPDKKFIIKISHLQSNYGIIVVSPYNKHNNEDYLEKIYQKCLEKFKTCFVCNHDSDNAPTIRDIQNSKKESHYKLYQTIEPGIIIQEFFYSKENSRSAPIEIKLLVYGDKIIKGINSTDIDRYSKVIEMAKNISKLLGSSLIRVDMFVKEKDNPYIPYLNEISLSPNGGFSSDFIDNEIIDNYKEKIKNYKPIDMEINDLIRTSPFRSIPIEKYLSDRDLETVKVEKFKF